MATTQHNSGDSSVLFNLRELMRIEEDRVDNERAAIAAAQRAEREAKALAEQQAVERRERDDRERHAQQVWQAADARVAEIKARLEREADERLEQTRSELRRHQVDPQHIVAAATPRPVPGTRLWLSLGCAFFMLGGALTFAYRAWLVPHLAALEAQATQAAQSVAAQQELLRRLQRELSAARQANAAPSPADSVVLPAVGVRASDTTANVRGAQRPTKTTRPTRQTASTALNVTSDALDSDSEDPLMGL